MLHLLRFPLLHGARFNRLRLCSGSWIACGNFHATFASAVRVVDDVGVYFHREPPPMSFGLFLFFQGALGGLPIVNTHPHFWVTL